MSALFALAAAIGWGSSDFAAGHASRKSSAISVVILTHFAAVIALLCFAVDFGPVWMMFGDVVRAVGPGSNGGPIRWSGPGVSGSPTAADLSWGLAAGLGGGFGAMLLFRGLGKGTMAVVAPITAAGAASIPVLFGILTGDPITVFGVAGIAVALVAIVLVSLSGEDSSAEPLIVPEDWSAQFRLPGPTGPAFDPPAPSSSPSPSPWLSSSSQPPPPPPPPSASWSPQVGAPVGSSTDQDSALMPHGRFAASPDVLSAPTAASAMPPAPPLPPPAIEMARSQPPRMGIHNGELRMPLRTVRQAVLALVATAVLSAAAIAARPINALLEGAEMSAPITATLVFALVIVGLAAFALNSVKPLFDFSNLTLYQSRTATTSSSPDTDPSDAPGLRSVVPSWRAIVGQPGVTEALLSGVGFGLFFVFIYRAGEDSGHWPLVSARLVSVLMFTLIALSTTSAMLPERGSRRYVVLAGLLDAAAAVFFVLSTRTGLLSVGAVLAALYPVATVLLARVITKERIRREQMAGLALALVAVGLLAA
jgi:drug/metabolite transporter (DMT)-like permease